MSRVYTLARMGCRQKTRAGKNATCYGEPRAPCARHVGIRAHHQSQGPPHRLKLSRDGVHSMIDRGWLKGARRLTITVEVDRLPLAVPHDVN